jgi:hypothetical protein
MADNPRDRLAAAEARASRPSANWLALVNELTLSKDPEVVLGAARLLAAHDPERARALLSALAVGENPAIRGEAAASLANDLPQSLAALRGLLHDADLLIRVTAAAKLLSQTR